MAQNDFTQGKVASAILRMALPMMAAQLVNVLYSVVDRMYLGHIEGAGTMALTGLGLCMPVISLVMDAADNHNQAAAKKEVS